MKLQGIIDYQMTNDEAEVYKLACLYEKEYTHTFGCDLDGESYRRNTLPKRGDPRKSNLYRYCWKLRRETRGLLQGHEYIPYLQANFMIFKINHDNGAKKNCIRVEPNIICGEKAWIRWKLVEKWRKDKASDVNGTPKPLPVANKKSIKDVISTKRFLFEKCDGDPSLEKLKNFYDQGFFKIWVVAGFVSKIYVLLSPFLEKICDTKAFMDECGIDPILVEEKITIEVKEYFENEFMFEF